MLRDLCDALGEEYEATQRLAQYVAKEYDRDRYSFLDQVAHCCDYYTYATSISQCFNNLSEEDQYRCFRVYRLWFMGFLHQGPVISENRKPLVHKNNPHGREL